MHLNLKDSVAAASLTASTLYVEAETSLFIAALLRLRRRSKQITNLVKYACIGGRIGTGCPANRRLINCDHLIQLFRSDQHFVLPRECPRPIQNPRKLLI